jgi:hypothetical protein
MLRRFLAASFLACTGLLSCMFAADTPTLPPTSWSVDYSRWKDGQRYATAEAKTD